MPKIVGFFSNRVIISDYILLCAKKVSFSSFNLLAFMRAHFDPANFEVSAPLIVIRYWLGPETHKANPKWAQHS